MKKFTLIPVFILAATIAFSQETTVDKSLKYFNKTEGGISFGLGSFKTDIYNGVQKEVRNDEIIVTIQTVNGFMYMNRVSLGLSVGAEIWQGGLFWPICGYLSYDFKPGEHNFYADTYIGYAIGTRDSTNFYDSGTGAFAFALGVGYKMKVMKKLKFMYEVFYKYQALDSKYTSYVERNDKWVPVSKTEYKIPLSFLGFKIGVWFP